MFFNFGYLSRHEVIGHSHLILSFPGVYWCGVSSLRATRWGGPVCFLLFCCPFPAFFWINQVFSISLLYFLYRLLSKSFPTIFFSQWFCSGTEHKHSPVECRWVGVVLLWSPLFILEPSPVPLLSHTWTPPLPASQVSQPRTGARSLLRPIPVAFTTTSAPNPPRNVTM